MFHSIGPAKPGFSPNRPWTVTAELLQCAIVEALAAGYQPVRVTDLPRLLRQSAAEQKYFALTFDDGYRDNLAVAAPICERFKVPMTVFVTTGLVQRTHTAWWHFLEAVIADNSAFQVTIGERRQTIECASAAAKVKVYEELAQKLMTFDDVAQQRFVESVPEPQRTAAVGYAQNLFLDTDELRRLAKLPRVEVGLHGVSHCPFSNLAAPRVNQELVTSLSYLRQISGQQHFALAYPHGTADTFDVSHGRMARELGIEVAVTTRHGCLGAGAVPDLLAAPRIPVFPEDDAATLQAKYSGATTLAAKLLGVGTRAA